jgi:hypothetical protein
VTVLTITLQPHLAIEEIRLVLLVDLRTVVAELLVIVQFQAFRAEHNLLLSEDSRKQVLHGFDAKLVLAFLL